MSLIWLSLAAVTGLIFYLYPELDLGFSSLFYDSEKGFALDQNTIVQLSYRSNRYFAITIGTATIGLLLITAVRKIALFGLNSKKYSYLLMVMILGPGLVVNTVFKNNWGRARPDDIVQFGGDKLFSPAFAISDQCERNCSFVSGHPSVFFFLVALGLILKGGNKAIAYGIAIGIGSLVGLGRIVQGGHFLSDVIFSFVFVAITAKIVHYFMFEYRIDTIRKIK